LLTLWELEATQVQAATLLVLEAQALVNHKVAAAAAAVLVMAMVKQAVLAALA
jgi:hypothetical protein